MTDPLYAAINGKRILITGGLGMIGSTLAHRLVNLGAQVTIVDSCLQPFGANLFNLHGIEDKVTVNICDIRDRDSMKVLVRGKEIIFNLAAQVSHNDSIDNPFLDADINYVGHLNVLECVRAQNQAAVILHAGSRLQFGRIGYLPVNEAHPLCPRTPYALHKTAAENCYLYYHNIHGLKVVAFRVANPYGPRSQMQHSKYSMVNWFIRQAMDGQAINIFGNGEQIRDYIHVDDLADAFIRAAVTERCYGELFNVGSGTGTTFKKMVETVVAAVGSGTVGCVPWPDNYINVETGDYITDRAKLTEYTGWQPEVSLTSGVAATVDYYRSHRKNYW
jgi:UDP-glucose 4-epimerase